MGTNPALWGEIPLDDAGGWSGRIGPLELWLTASAGDVAAAWMQGPDPLAEGWVHGPGAEPPAGAQRRRIATSRAPLRLLPALADRAVVVRPEVPLHLPPGERAELLISTPLWVQLCAGDPPQVVLDVPAFRPSDTWFGPSPRSGEICYASRTRARVRAAAATSTPARAHSVLTLRNEGEDVLPVERISLPVPRLGLYGDGEGMIWTDALSLARQPGEGMAEVTIHRGPPPGVPDARRIAEPRNPDHRNVFARAVWSLLG